MASDIEPFGGMDVFDFVRTMVGVCRKLLRVRKRKRTKVDNVETNSLSGGKRSYSGRVVNPIILERAESIIREARLLTGARDDTVDKQRYTAHHHN